MPKIKMLSREVSELIAAGEVIERPASVIKELVENSIDSGAGRITVETKNGGTTYMRVTDDGCGMAFDEVPTAFLRHATSKVAVKKDLDNICTLGFRGEALASVSAVSKVEVMTKQAEETYGTIFKIEGSEAVLHEQCGCPDGTTIIVRDIFYNVPVRRKFMKKDVTEANAVSLILQKIALSHPEISIKLIRYNRMEFNTSGDGELYTAIHAVYGKDFARDLIFVDYTYECIRIYGYAVKPLYAKQNRTFQNFFVNGRYVKSMICSAALESAFTNMIMTGKFPACVLKIDMPPSDIDVNIHPSKAEVRFTDEKKVSDAIYFAIKSALVDDGLLYSFEIKPQIDWTSEGEENKADFDEKSQQEIIFTPVDKIHETENAIANVYEADLSESLDKTDADTVSPPSAASVNCDHNDDNAESDLEAENEKFVSPKASEDVETYSPEEFKYLNAQSFAKTEEVNKVQPAVNEVKRDEPEIKVIGEAFKNYIMAEAGDNIIMIDKHAAHERIIFERLKSRNCRQYSQMLITEIRVLLPLNEFDALENNQDLLADMGFNFDFSNPPYALAKAVPTFLTNLNLDEVIPEIAENLFLGKQNPQTHVLDDMLHTLACKSAIKANDKTDIIELQSLAEQVYYNEKIRHCPHGRPVMFTMSKGSIEHQFKRT